MMKTFFATTALVGILFVTQPEQAAGEPIPDVVFNYIAKSKLLVKYRTQIDTYQELIDEHISDMQKTPTAAEMKLLNSDVSTFLRTHFMLLFERFHILLVIGNH